MTWLISFKESRSFISLPNFPIVTFIVTDSMMSRRGYIDVFERGEVVVLLLPLTADPESTVNCQRRCVSIRRPEDEKKLAVDACLKGVTASV